MMNRAFGMGVALATLLLAAGCTAGGDSYGGTDADPPGVAGPKPPRPKKGNNSTSTSNTDGADVGDTKGDDIKSDDIKSDDSTKPADPTGPTDPTAPRALEVGAYYAGYTASTLPLAKLDFKVLDSVTHFAVLPQADGGLDDATNMVDVDSGTHLTTAARAAGVKSTLCIGGQATATAFAAATKDHETDLVKNIAKYVTDRGYDGVDIDWEPLAPADAAAFATLITDLRAKLGKDKTISAAVPVGSGAVVAPIAASLDRIHLMSYDLAGPWQGWVTWHNGALYNGGATFPSTGGKLPSVSDSVTDFIAAGVPASKIMLGIDHQGYAWKGGTSDDGSALVSPRMTWSVAPTMQPIPYRDIADTLLTADNTKWDDVAKAPFLAIDEAGTANDQFITYENEDSQREKVSFARTHGLAGVFVWDIAAGYRPSQAEPLGLMNSLHTDAH